MKTELQINRTDKTVKVHSIYTVSLLVNLPVLIYISRAKLTSNETMPYWAMLK